MATYRTRRNPDGSYTSRRQAGPFLRVCTWLLLLGLIAAGIANGTAAVRAVCIIFAVIVAAGIAGIVHGHRR